MDVAQTAPYIQTMTYEAGILEHEDFPRTETLVYILGTIYSAIHEMDDISHDMKSRLWFTYRWGFPPIGGEGPTSDQGWGCMLRCGQMMLAQALVNLHLGRAWRWNEGKNDSKYYRILKLFLDRRDSASAYSIHQIANMGASEGKAIGQWFGPNTIAQVLKKLSVYEDWSNLCVHVALDNTVIINDIKTVCKCKCDYCQENDKTTGDQSGNSSNTETSKTKTKSEEKTSILSGAKINFNRIPVDVKDTPLSYTEGHQASSLMDQVRASRLDYTRDLTNQQLPILSCDMCRVCSLAGLNLCACKSKGSKHWKPLLLIIPLRLGITDINPVYVDSLKMCFRMKQTVGIIGGKPNMAHWFVGTVGDELIFLDPHTCQPHEEFTQTADDESFHCPYKCRMSISELDPSIAVGFFCATEADFEEMCRAFRKLIIAGAKTPLFEIHEDRPKHWPPFEPYKSPLESSGTEFEEVPSVYDSEEEFVML